MPYPVTIQPEVKDALAAGKAVVALESTIISHGLPFPENLETARAIEQMVRDHGAIPATIAIIKGDIKIGTHLRIPFGVWHNWQAQKVTLPKSHAAILPLSSPARAMVQPRLLAR